MGKRNIILTLLAIYLLIGFSFYLSDRQSRSGIYICETQENVPVQSQKYVSEPTVEDCAPRKLVDDTMHELKQAIFLTLFGPLLFIVFLIGL